MLPREVLELCQVARWGHPHAFGSASSLRFSRRAFSSTSRVANTRTKPDKQHLVTTPIFYVNASPHLGHLHSMVLADVFHRYNELKTGKTGQLCTGTDEHGLKIQKVAEVANEDPQALCDRVSLTFKNLAEMANIQYTRFIRTTDQDHVHAVKHLWSILMKKGYIYKGRHEGWYSVSDEAFYSSTQVSDQTDPSTGESYKIADETGNRVEWSSEENYMFRLSHFQDRLIDWLSANESRLVPAARYLEVLRYLRDEPLADLSVSRPRSRLRWGVAVPGDEDHTIYVWLDALANYLTVSGWPDHAPGSNTSTWPANLHVIGKDIIRFHIVYWPAFLMAADLPLPQTVLAHAHWTMDHFKMSKSRGNVVDPIKTMHSVGPDAMRYYLMRMGGSLATDTNFSTEGLLEVYRKDLAGQLGNLLSRITSAKVAGRLASPSEAFHLPLKRNVELDALFTKVPDRVVCSMERYQPSQALQSMFSLLTETNQFLAAVEPWRAVCSDEDAQAAFFYSIEALRYVAFFLQPFMPGTSARLHAELGLSSSSWDEMKLGALAGKASFPLGQRSALFPRVEGL